VPNNLNSIFILVIFLTIFAIVVINLKDWKLFFSSISKDKIQDNNVSLNNHRVLVYRILDAAINNDHEKIIKILRSQRSYNLSHIMASALRLAVNQYSLTFITLLEVEETFCPMSNEEEFYNLLKFAQSEEAWGVSTVLVRRICRNSERSPVFLASLFESYYKEKRSKEALVVFCALPKKYKTEFIELYYKKLIILCCNEPSYFLEGLKILEQKKTLSIKD
jgi:hypothetical protein